MRILWDRIWNQNNSTIKRDQVNLETKNGINLNMTDKVDTEVKTTKVKLESKV